MAFVKGARLTPWPMLSRNGLGVGVGAGARSEGFFWCLVSSVGEAGPGELMVINKGFWPLRGCGATGVAQRLVVGVTLRLKDGGVGQGRKPGGEPDELSVSGDTTLTLLAHGLLLVGVMLRLAEDEEEALGEGGERGQSQVRSSRKFETDIV